MDTTVELYGANTGNSLRAAIALEEAGIAYLPCNVDLSANEHRNLRYVALNPAAKVPTLVDHSTQPSLVINQSNAIIQFAESKAPGRLAPPLPGYDRDRVFDRYFFFVTDVIALSHSAFFLRRAGFGDAANALDQRVIDQIIFAESFLTDEFMGGKQFSMADIPAFTIIASVRDRLDWSRLPKLLSWFKVIEARPAVKRGLKVFHRI